MHLPLRARHCVRVAIAARVSSLSSARRPRFNRRRSRASSTATSTTSRGDIRRSPPATACTITTICSTISPRRRFAPRSRRSSATASSSTRSTPTTLTPDERVDRRILDGIIDGWLLEQETLENWRRNPMLYASALTDGVHNLMAMESNPAPVRMRRIISKLRQTPALLAAARANIANPPKLFAERGASMMRGASDMLGKDLDLAFASEPNRALRDSLRRAADAAIPQIDAYATYLERDVVPKATGDFTIGAANVARRYRAEELIDTPLDAMIAIGERELARLQQEFRAAANRLAPGRDPQQVWAEVRKNHPKIGRGRRGHATHRRLARRVRVVARHRDASGRASASSSRARFPSTSASRRCTRRRRSRRRRCAASSTSPTRGRI